MAAMGFRDHLATFSVVGEPWEMRVDNADFSYFNSYLVGKNMGKHMGKMICLMLQKWMVYVCLLLF